LIGPCSTVVVKISGCTTRSRAYSTNLDWAVAVGLLRHLDHAALDLRLIAVRLDVVDRDGHGCHARSVRR